jgi:hypothetical protein
MTVVDELSDPTGGRNISFKALGWRGEEHELILSEKRNMNPKGTGSNSCSAGVGSSCRRAPW